LPISGWVEDEVFFAEDLSAVPSSR
jgi:hypothetical protein